MTKPSIDWGAVHPRFQWLGVDANGWVSLFRGRPYKNPHMGEWVVTGYDAEYGDADNFASYRPCDCPWDESLVERPAVREVSITIIGEPASKANSRKSVTRGRGGPKMFIKSDKARGYETSAKLQIRTLPQLIECDVSVTIHIYYATRRPDLDESIILDVMQGKIYKNDRQVKEKHIFWHLDKENPRAEIVVREIV